MQLQSFTHILNRRMSRKDFLRTLALAALACIGLGFLIKSPMAASRNSTAPASQSNQTYGIK